jgi:hypothetical protein
MMIGVVRMPRPKGVQDVTIVLAAMISISYQKANGGPSSLALKYSREDFNFILFFALSNMPRGAGLTAI